jgi:hypothetical protein
LNQTDSMLEAYWIAPNASCPDMVGWRSWRADRVGRDRERICRIATRRDAMPKKQLATPAMPGGRAYDDYTPFEPIVWSHAYRVWLRMNSFVGGYPIPHFKQAKPISLSL